MLEHYLSIDDIRKLKGCTRQYINKEIVRGNLKSVKHAGKHFIRKEDYEEWNSTKAQKTAGIEEN